jgi:hypothetical protein
MNGLGVSDVSVLKTERKTSNREDNCGLVIASFQSLDNRRKVLSVKTKLKDSK